MIRNLILLLFLPFSAFSQNALSPLTIEKIMRDPIWIGTSPSNIRWSPDSRFIYFNWNPGAGPVDSLYRYSLAGQRVDKVDFKQLEDLVTADEISYNDDRSAWTWSKRGNIFYQSASMDQPLKITHTLGRELNPRFSFNNRKIVFTLDDNLFAWDIASGSLNQLTNFIKSAAPRDARASQQDAWLKNDQLREFEILRQRRERQDSLQSINKRLNAAEIIKPIYLGEKSLSGLQISPDGRFVFYELTKVNRPKSTFVPAYVTESGFTENLPARTKVGDPADPQELMIFDILRDSAYDISVKTLPGIKDIPTFIGEYPELRKSYQKDSAERALRFSNIQWSPEGRHAVVDIRAQDNKDRWICSLDPETGRLSLLDRQHDEAWIGGPGIGGGFGGGSSGWLNEEEFWFQSEVTGYSHLYKIHVPSLARSPLTVGNFEILRATISADRKLFTITTNEVHPGEQQIYHLSAQGGQAIRITDKTGAHQASPSPDGKQLAYLYSYSNIPWELYLQENKAGAQPRQITDKAVSAEFKTYPWRDPEGITITARDGAKIHARLYRPAKKINNKAAVIFVHGAGYLQNAHRWWSSYFREYLFHNLLADQGYTVLDMDYRGSAGYGRDWRTGIYRYMGGKDLTDHVDGAKYLAEQHGVNPKKIGIYGGSYGGFITLMGLFTTPDVFAAGAALRPVTDWAQYNHGYTSNILNEPFTDSLAYRRSSPFYYAAGLKNPLLICHGMIDVNVHYQDAVKLSQRLIELKKENWELASYPMEDHGFVEPTSWMDEYKRILNLFNKWLR